MMRAMNAWCHAPLTAEEIGHVLEAKKPLWCSPEEERRSKRQVRRLNDLANKHRKVA